MLLSVCICTYNRCAILKYCLEALASLGDKPPGWSVEILVIDNNSSDRTAEVVRSFTADFPFPLRYVFEAEQGLSAARNRAISEAAGDYLAFLDDECTVDRNWLFKAAALVDEFKPSIAGGPYFGAFLPGNRPQWFKAEYGDAYFIEFNLARGFHRDFRASGGNMLVKRDVFEDLRFDVTMGAKARELKVGEEMDLQERFLHQQTKGEIFYEPFMIVHHYILPEKMRLTYHARRLFKGAVARANSADIRTLGAGLVRALAHAMLFPLESYSRDRSKYPFWQNYAYERTIPPVSQLFGAVIAKISKSSKMSDETEATQGFKSL